MSEEAPMTDAQKRAAARKAKILARGNAGLAKLAQTARGEEAEMLYGGDSASSTRPGTPSQSAKAPSASTSSATGEKKPSWAPPTQDSPSARPSQARAGAGVGAAPGMPGMPGMGGMGSDPNADPFAQMMAMLNGGAGGPGAEGMPDMSRLLAQMMGGAAPGAPGAEGNMPNLLGMGDLDNPAGLGGVPPLNANGMPNFPDMSAFANMPGMAGMMPGMGAPQGKGWVEKLYPLIHFIGVLVLLAFAVVWWEPTIRAARWANKLDGETTLGRWARLAGRGGARQVAASGMLGNVEVLPIFWAFTTLQLILQTTRFFILKGKYGIAVAMSIYSLQQSPPAPHSMISTFLPLLPPAISRPVLTGSRYLSMLSQVYKDGCLLIFGVGMMVVVAEYTQTWR